jgi:hypothetical protein
VISFLCGDYYLSVSKYDSENEMIEKLRRKNDSIILKKMEHVLDSYIINGYCEMSGNSIGIGVLSSNPVTPPTVSFDPFGFLYIHNGQIFSVVDLNKKATVFEYQAMCEVFFFKVFPQAILLVEEIQIDLLSRTGDCIRSYALDDILEDYHFIGTTFHYKTSSSSGIIDLEHFGLL